LGYGAAAWLYKKMKPIYQTITPGVQIEMNSLNQNLMTKKTLTTAKIHPDTIMHEIRNAIRRLGKILKPYDDIGYDLESQVALSITNGRSLYCTLNNSWPVSIKEAVKKAIISTTHLKYPQIIVISIT
jgi:hypothetical protein